MPLSAALLGETPPRTWGRLQPVTEYRAMGGNTPTHVGKTGTGFSPTAMSKKHPHARGEDRYSPSHQGTFLETPPRTWGRLATPGLPSARKKKHPHARGEDRRRIMPMAYSWETPPRTWGRRTQLLHLHGRAGNTPTHVGKTMMRSRRVLLARKHPHARGEDAKTLGWPMPKLETPPRTWGRPFSPSLLKTIYGNTPTHVGKTWSVHVGARPRRKHPHARGEDGMNRQSGARGEETPPRTWGRPVFVYAADRQNRNTPTHVGKTCRREFRYIRR